MASSTVDGIQPRRHCVLQHSWESHLFDIVFRNRLGGAVHSILLHVLGHVGILDYGLSLLRHGAAGDREGGGGYQRTVAGLGGE